MRRLTSLALGALAFVALASGSAAIATDETTTTTAPPTTTTSAKPTTTTGAVVTVPTSTPGKPGATTTTAKPSTTATTAGSGSQKPIPPPASGASQPLDPSILGSTPLPETATTLFGVETVTVPQQTRTISDDPTGTAQVVSSTKNKPNGTTLVLAAVAWLASLGGLLIYAEDQRGLRWRHLAR